jgi:hypothetical protein
MIDIDTDTARPIAAHCRSVGRPMLQSEVLIADDIFTRLFPDLAGYRMVFVRPDAAPTRPRSWPRSRIARPYGLDL